MKQEPATREDYLSQVRAIIDRRSDRRRSRRRTRRDVALQILTSAAGTVVGGAVVVVLGAAVGLIKNLNGGWQFFLAAVATGVIIGLGITALWNSGQLTPEEGELLDLMYLGREKGWLPEELQHVELPPPQP